MRHLPRFPFVLLLACSASPSQGTPKSMLTDASTRSDARNGSIDGSARHDAEVARGDAEGGSPRLSDGGDDAAQISLDASPDQSAPCSTEISYGSAWIRPANHTGDDDVTGGLVTWDGSCTNDGPNSYALLSNGWKPYFNGNSACVLALDVSASCGPAASCTTRVTYGAGWLPPANHPTDYDEIAGRVFANGACTADGTETYTQLSNGWQPHFQGACGLSIEYLQCGGLYENPVVSPSCPDPGVLYDNGQYILACTSGDAPDAYPLYTSPDLVHWVSHGSVFPSGHWPSWAVGDFWAPEVHKVGAHYVVYFSANSTAGHYSIGAASAPSPLGPFTDIGQPLIAEAGMGLIDASELNAAGGAPYVLWKEDGNAIGQPTPIHSQPLASDGLSLTGSPATLITNDEAWEGAVTEAPFMVENGGAYFLFYSGNSYANASYAVGVAQATTPSGPFTKLGTPILGTGGAWVGPGHCSVVTTPFGETYMVYAAWESGCVNGAGCNRLALTDQITWNGWPSVPFAPSTATRPLP